jgi:hypothetical protein
VIESVSGFSEITNENFELTSRFMGETDNVDSLTVLSIKTMQIFDGILLLNEIIEFSLITVSI